MAGFPRGEPRADGPPYRITGFGSGVSRRGLHPPSAPTGSSDPVTTATRTEHTCTRLEALARLPPGVAPWRLGEGQVSPPGGAGAAANRRRRRGASAQDRHVARRRRGPVGDRCATWPRGLSVG